MPGYRCNRSALRRRLPASVLIACLLIISGHDVVQASTSAIKEAQSEARALVELVNRLDQELGAATEEYNYANQRLQDSKAAAKKLSLQVKQAETDLALTQNRLDRRVVDMYKIGNLGALEVLLGVGSFSEFVSRLEELAVIGRQDAELVDRIAVYKDRAADQKAELDGELRQQATYAEQTAAAKQKVLEQLTKQKEALKGKEAQIAKLKREEAARQARLAAEERARQAFLASRPGKVIQSAMQYLGVPYVWGGAGPSGFDCSGLVQYVYAKVGVSLPHSSRMQYDCGTPVSRSDLKAGDLVFYYHPIQHVGIYIGNGRIINATGNQVQISAAFGRGYVGACRVL